MLTQAIGVRPVTLRLAAAAQAAEAVGLVVAGVFSAVATADGQSYQMGSGIALTVIAFCTAVTLATFARALDRARAWSRTPVVMTQLFVIVAGVTLIGGHRLAWGVSALLLAVGCLAGLFTPASLRALNRSPRPSQPASGPPASGQPAKGRPASGPPAKGQPASGPPAKGQPARKSTR